MIIHGTEVTTQWVREVEEVKVVVEEIVEDEGT